MLADPAVLKVFQNAKYDLAILHRAGAPAALPLDDTMVISFAMEAGLHGHGMDELSALHLGHTPISYDSVTGTGKGRREMRCDRGFPTTSLDIGDQHGEHIGLNVLSLGSCIR